MAEPDKTAEAPPPPSAAAEAAARAKAQVDAGRAAVANVGRRVAKRLSFFGDLFESTGSEDRPTRRMANVFVLSSLALLVVVGMGVQYAIRHSPKAPADHEKSIEEEGAELSRMLGKAQAAAGRTASVVNLGTFVIDVNEVPGAPTRARHVQNLIEIDLTLGCDLPETRSFVEHHMEQVRDQINQALIGTDRDLYLTHEGKKKLKKVLMKRLDEWLPEGKVVDVYITRLLVG